MENAFDSKKLEALKHLVDLMEKLHELNKKAKTEEEKEALKKLGKIFEDLGKGIGNI